MSWFYQVRGAAALGAEMMGLRPNAEGGGIIWAIEEVPMTLRMLRYGA